MTADDRGNSEIVVADNGDRRRRNRVLRRLLLPRRDVARQRGDLVAGARRAEHEHLRRRAALAVAADRSGLERTGAAVPHSTRAVLDRARIDRACPHVRADRTHLLSARRGVRAGRVRAARACVERRDAAGRAGVRRRRAAALARHRACGLAGGVLVVAHVRCGSAPQRARRDRAAGRLRSLAMAEIARDSSDANARRPDSRHARAGFRATRRRHAQHAIRTAALYFVAGGRDVGFGRRVDRRRRGIAADRDAQTRAEPRGSARGLRALFQRSGVHGHAGPGDRAVFSEQRSGQRDAARGVGRGRL